MKKIIFNFFLSICLLLSCFILIPKFSHAASETGRLFIQVQDSETYAGIEGAYFAITSIENPTNETLVRTDVNGQINEEFIPGNYMIKQLSTTDKDENYAYTSIGFSRLIEAGQTVNVVGFENKLRGSYIFSGSPVEVHVPLNSKFDAANQGIIAFKLNRDGTLGAQLTSAWLYPYYNNVNTSIPGEYVSIYKGYQTFFNKSTSHVLKVIVDPETPIIAAHVIIKYVDGVGNELASSETLNGKVGLPYESKAKVLEGYTLKETPSNATGIFTNEEQTVTYVYIKNQVKAGDVTVRYEDEAGNELSGPAVLSGNEGEAYTSEQKYFPGYTLKEVKGAVSGIFGTEPQQVVYVYQKEGTDTDQSTLTNDTNPADSTPSIENGENKGEVTTQSQTQESVTPTVVQNQSVTSNPKQELVKKENKPRKDGTLPQTNEQITPFFSIAGVVLVGISLLSGLLYKHKKRIN